MGGLSVDCPKGWPPGPCCGITKTGATYVQKVLACQRAVLSTRVDIRKGGGDLMAAKPDRSQVRKALWDLITQTADRLQRESRTALSKSDALVATMEQYPTLATAYTDAVKRGDPPSEVFSAEPVAKAAPSERDQVFATIMKRATDLAATKGITKERAMVDDRGGPEPLSAIPRRQAMTHLVPARARHVGAAVISRGARRSLSEGTDVLGRH
jgi:hypothetical protein